jgi:hypothetical protein
MHLKTNNEKSDGMKYELYIDEIKKLINVL